MFGLLPDQLALLDLRKEAQQGAIQASPCPAVATVDTAAGYTCLICMCTHVPVFRWTCLPENLMDATLPNCVWLIPSFSGAHESSGVTEQ